MPGHSKTDQVVDYVTRKMDSGEWPPGHKLPPDRELRAELNVSQITIRFAMERLKGRVESQQGVGRFVKK